MSKVIVLFFFGVCVSFVYCQFEEICTTIDQEIGSCIQLQNCRIYMELLQDPRTKEDTFQILRRVNCGFDGSNPKICCPRSNSLSQYPQRPPDNNVLQIPVNNYDQRPVDNYDQRPINNYDQRPINNSPQRPPNNNAQRPQSNNPQTPPNNNAQRPTNNNAQGPPYNAQRPQNNNVQRPPINNAQRPTNNNVQGPPNNAQRPPNNNAQRPPNNIAQRPTQSRRPGPSGDFVSALPEPPVCGVTVTLNRVFSQSVNLDTFPWLGFLGYQSRQGRSIRWLCGGSLISSKHMLTAAHCIYENGEDLVLVRLGGIKHDKRGGNSGPIDVQIKSKIIHEQFNPADYSNDIGILVLRNDVPFSDTIKPICIPKTRELRTNSFVNYHPMVAAWSDKEPAGQLPSQVKAHELPVWNNERCTTDYSRVSQAKIDERVLCAGYRTGDEDVCHGDSGGPLMQPITNQPDSVGYYYQTGIVSYVKKCAERGFPGVYTRVTHFVPWIEEKVLGYSSS